MSSSLVLFSGGLDSIVATAKEAVVRDRVSLITVDNGALWNLDLAYTSFKNIRDKHKNVTPLVIADGRYLFKRYVVEPIEEDFKKYNYNLLCAGCKLVMYTIAVAHALAEDIDYVVDGVTVRQSTFPEQKYKVVKWFDDFAERLGVKLLHPVKDVKSKSEIKYLAMKYRIPPKAIEPTCLFGNSHNDNIPEDVIIEYLNEKKELLMDEIDSMIEEQWYISEIYHF